MTGTATLLELDGLTAGYTRPVVGPVSLRIEPGEVLGLNGPNGAGKTTLINALMGAARVFSGEVHRKPGLRVAHHRQRPERPDELPLRASELMALLDARAPDALTRLLDRPLDELSGGQFQFLHTCACLGSDAELVLLDEPTNNLDGEGIGLLTEWLHALEPARAVVLVSHETEFLRANCTRIIELTA